MKKLGEKMARKRKDLGMTQVEFAEKLSVTRQTVSRWEAGSVLPDIDKIADIAAILGVSCDYLLNDAVTDEGTAASVGSAGRLLQQAVGKTVRIHFFDEEADVDLYNTDCTIVAFEGNWVRLTAETRKGRVEKLIPLSSVLSLEFVKGAE